MERSLTLPFTVRSFEIDGHSRALLKTVTNYLQETAVRHAIELNVARGQMEEHLTWMLSRLRLEMERWPAWGDEVTVRTWPSGIKGLFALMKKLRNSFFTEKRPMAFWVSHHA